MKATTITRLRLQAGNPEGLTPAGEWVPVPWVVYNALLPFLLACQARAGREN